MPSYLFFVCLYCVAYCLMAGLFLCELAFDQLKCCLIQLSAVLPSLRARERVHPVILSPSKYKTALLFRSTDSSVTNTNYIDRQFPDFSLFSIIFCIYMCAPKRSRYRFLTCVISFLFTGTVNRYRTKYILYDFKMECSFYNIAGQWVLDESVFHYSLFLFYQGSK